FAYAGSKDLRSGATFGTDRGTALVPSKYLLADGNRCAPQESLHRLAPFQPRHGGRLTESRLCDQRAPSSIAGYSTGDRPVTGGPRSVRRGRPARPQWLALKEGDQQVDAGVAVGFGDHLIWRVGVARRHGQQHRFDAPANQLGAVAAIVLEDRLLDRNAPRARRLDGSPAHAGGVVRAAVLIDHDRAMA